MGICCLRCKKNDSNETGVNDDILWLKTNSSLTTPFASDLHFSIGGSSNTSNQQAASVTCVREAQKKEKREGAKLDSRNTEGEISHVDEGKTSQAKPVLEAQNVNITMKDNRSKDEPGKTQEGSNLKANDSLLTKATKEVTEIVETAKETVLPNFTAGLELQGKVKADQEQPLVQVNALAANGTSEVTLAKAQRDFDSLIGKNTDKVHSTAEAEKSKLHVAVKTRPKDDVKLTSAKKVATEIADGVLQAGNDVKLPEGIPLKSVSKIEHDSHNVVRETEDPDVMINGDVMNKEQSDVNREQLDVVAKPAIAITSSQISTSFDGDNEAEDKAECRVIIPAVENSHDQSAVIETDCMHDDEAEKENSDKIGISTNQNGSTSNELTADTSVFTDNVQEASGQIGQERHGNASCKEMKNKIDWVNEMHETSDKEQDKLN